MLSVTEFVYCIKTLSESTTSGEHCTASHITPSAVLSRMEDRTKQRRVHNVTETCPEVTALFPEPLSCPCFMSLESFGHWQAYMIHVTVIRYVYVSVLVLNISTVFCPEAVPPY